MVFPQAEIARRDEIEAGIEIISVLNEKQVLSQMERREEPDSQFNFS
jgi:hypothetical protein